MEPFKGLLLALTALFINTAASYSAGMNVCLCSGDKKIVQSDMMIDSFRKENEKRSNLLFENRELEDLELRMISAPDMEYYIDLLEIGCTKGSVSNIVLDTHGNLIKIKKELELYTALDSNGDMVGGSLRKADAVFWPELKGVLARFSDKKIWVNIDFKDMDFKSYNFIVINYAPTYMLEGRIRETFAKEKKEDKDKKESVSAEDTGGNFLIHIKQWNDQTWEYIGKIGPSSAGVRRMAVLFEENGFSAGKFRIELRSGNWILDSIYLASGDALAIKKNGGVKLPDSLLRDDGNYLHLESGESRQFDFRGRNNEICLLGMKGYYLLKDAKKDIPKSVDDIINKFLSRIKFWERS